MQEVLNKIDEPAEQLSTLPNKMTSVAAKENNKPAMDLEGDEEEDEMMKVSRPRRKMRILDDSDEE